MNDGTRQLLTAFLDEDLGRGDITSELVVGEHETALGLVHSGEAATLAGVEEAAGLAAIKHLDFRQHAADGDEIGPEHLVLEIGGPARDVLGVERTLLNLMSHLSGVATLTRQAVSAVTTAHTGIRASDPPRIAATRKTVPGMRALQKKAVVLGGGLPHRFDLAEAVLIKDNHLSVDPDVAAVVRRARKHADGILIEVEVETGEDALIAARSGADALLLDNFSPAGIVAVVEELVSAGLREAVSLEASGGITLQTVGDYADTGVDVVSMGILTSSARHIDFSLHFAL